MFGLFVIISIATHFITGINPAYVPEQPSNIVLETSFSSISGLKIGSPVTVRGELIGEVLKIDDLDKKKNETSGNRSSSINVQISLKTSEFLSNSAIALIATPMSPSGVRQQSVVEILLPNSNSKNQPLPSKIKGYSSYKEFWLSSDTKKL